MTTDLRIHDDCHFVDIHVGGSEGFEDYGEDVVFVRLQCHGGNDVQLWLDRSAVVMLQDAIKGALK